MDRREFLKLSTLFAAAMAIESSPTLRNAARLIELDPHNPMRIVLYKVRKKSNGRWKVKGTKYVDLAHKRFDKDLFYEDSFTVLDIVDNSVAKERRKELSIEHDCAKPHPGNYNFEIFTNNANRAVITNRESGQIRRWTITGHIVRDLMIQTGEWSEVAKRGGYATKNWSGQLEHMRSINEQGRQLSAINRKKKAKKTNSERIDALLSVMEHGVYYTADQITDMFPWFHTFAYPQKATRRFILRNQQYFKVKREGTSTTQYNRYCKI